MNNNLPGIVREAFPAIVEAVFVRQLASPVPLVPDTTFDIYIEGSKDYIALVTTDYADPLDQSQELKKISGQYEFEFSNLIKPYGQDGIVTILEHDEMDGDFFVTTPHKNYNLYYYLANLVSKRENN